VAGGKGVDCGAGGAAPTQSSFPPPQVVPSPTPHPRFPCAGHSSTQVFAILFPRREGGRSTAGLRRGLLTGLNVLAIARVDARASELSLVTPGARAAGNGYGLPIAGDSGCLCMIQAEVACT